MRDINLERAARTALNKILAKSIAKRWEYGGMIYLQDGKYSFTEARTQEYGNTVNVGQWELNRSCPEGSTPIAYYHTHPNIRAGGIPMEYNKFSDEDKQLATDISLYAYLGTLDGSFFVFDYRNGEVTRIRGRRLKNTE